ncbi:MAG: transposase [Thermoanaerobaculia bacterium]
MACGYEDCNDATELRHEPAFLTAMGRVAGQEGSALASQPTLSRFARFRRLSTATRITTGGVWRQLEHGPQR